MALEFDPNNYLSTPAGNATPQELESARQIAATLMRPSDQKMQSWTQPAAQIVNALLGVRMMQNANARDQMLTRGLSMGGTVPATLPATSASSASSDPMADQGGPQPASIRYNNPGAQWPGPSASNYGATGYGVIGGGNKIAQFPDAESGAAAQFDLLARNYTGMRLADAVHRWSGGNSSQAYTAAVSQATGLSPDTPLTPQMLSDPGVAVPLAKAMAQVETGRPYPLSDEQWRAAHARVFGGATQTAEGGSVRMDAPSVPAAGVSVGPPSSPAGAQTQPPVSPTGQGPQLTPGASTSPQMPNGAGASPSGQGPTNQFNEYIPRGAVRVTPEVPLERIQALYALRSPEALKLASELQAQNVQRSLPQTIPYQGGQLVIPDPINHPEQQMFMRGAPTIQRGKAGDVEAPIGSTYTDQYGQTHVQPMIQDQPVGGAGTPGTPGVSFTQGGSGGMPDSPRPTLGGLAEFGTQLKRQEAEAQATGKQSGDFFGSMYKGLQGGAMIAAEQKRYIGVMKQILDDPDFASGTAPGIQQAVQRAFATAKMDPTRASMTELFKMIRTSMVQDQVSGLRSMTAETGEQGTRVFALMNKLEDEAMPNADDTLAGLRQKMRVLDQVGDIKMKAADAADDYAANHGNRLDPGFNKQIRKLLSESGISLLSKEEAGRAPGTKVTAPATAGAGAPAVTGSIPGGPASAAVAPIPGSDLPKEVLENEMRRRGLLK